MNVWGFVLNKWAQNLAKILGTEYFILNIMISLLNGLNELFWFKYKLFKRWFEMITNEWYLWIKKDNKWMISLN